MPKVWIIARSTILDQTLSLYKGLRNCSKRMHIVLRHVLLSKISVNFSTAWYTPLLSKHHLDANNTIGIDYLLDGVFNTSPHWRYVTLNMTRSLLWNAVIPSSPSKHLWWPSSWQWYPIFMTCICQWCQTSPMLKQGFPHISQSNVYLSVCSSAMLFYVSDW